MKRPNPGTHMAGLTVQRVADAARCPLTFLLASTPFIRDSSGPCGPLYVSPFKVAVGNYFGAMRQELILV